LGTERAAASGNDRCHHVRVEVGEMLEDEIAVKEQVSPVGLPLVALGGWGGEGGIVVAAAVNPQFTPTVFLRFPPLLLILTGCLRVGGEEGITAPVQMEEVITFL